MAGVPQVLPTAPRCGRSTAKRPIGSPRVTGSTNRSSACASFGSRGGQRLAARAGSSQATRFVCAHLGRLLGIKFLARYQWWSATSGGGGDAGDAATAHRAASTAAQRRAQALVEQRSKGRELGLDRLGDHVRSIALLSRLSATSLRRLFNLARILSIARCRCSHEDPSQNQTDEDYFSLDDL